MDDLLNKFIRFSRDSLKVDMTAENLDAPVSTLGLDSLDFIEYLMSLEGEFGAKLDLDLLQSDATLNEIYQLIYASRHPGATP